MHEKHRASCVYWMCGKPEKMKGEKKKKMKRTKRTFVVFMATTHTNTHTHTHVMSVRARAWCLVSLIQCQLFSLAAIWCIILKHGLLGCTVSSRREADWHKKKKKKRAADVCMSLSGWAWSELRRRAANLASFPRIPYRLHQLIMI